MTWSILPADDQVPALPVLLQSACVAEDTLLAAPGVDIASVKLAGTRVGLGVAPHHNFGESVMHYRRHFNSFLIFNGIYETGRHFSLGSQ